MDDHTVKMTLTKPFGALPQVLPWIWIVNPRIVEANKGSDDGQTFLRKTGAPGEAHYSTPHDSTTLLPAGTVFPMAHTAAIIAAP